MGRRTPEEYKGLALSFPRANRALDSLSPTFPPRPAVVLGILSAVGLGGLAPSRGAGLDPAALLTWLALAATALGVLAGAWLPRATALLVTLPWWAAVEGLGRRAPGALPDPTGAWWAAAGLFTLGWGAGCLWRHGAVRIAGAALLISGLLAALPSGGGRLAQPWPPGAAARLLDLSPVAIVLECGGLDFMRHPAVYGPVGTMDIGPELRAPWRATTAAVPLLLLGAALAGAASLRGAR